jgi:hypothetical protein
LIFYYVAMGFGAGRGGWRIRRRSGLRDYLSNRSLKRQRALRRAVEESQKAAISTGTEPLRRKFLSDSFTCDIRRISFDERLQENLYKTVKINLLLLSAVLAAAGLNAAPSLIVGTPGNSYLATPTGPNPSFGTLYNFDSLSSGSTFSASTYGAEGVSISSPDGLMVEPYSTQSSPNELFDNSAAGSANISITTFGTNEIGIGIADSDAATVTLQALNAQGVGFGSRFSLIIPAGASNPGVGYFVIADAAYDIYGLQVLQPLGDASYSGLAIDDLQVASAPEPATVALFCIGALMLGTSRLRKRS